MSKILGASILFLVGGVPVAGQTGLEYNVDVEFIDVSDKNDYPDTVELPAGIKRDGTVDALMETATGGFQALHAAVEARQPVTAVIAVSDLYTITCTTTYLNNLKLSAPQKGAASLSLGYKMTGTVTLE